MTRTLAAIAIAPLAVVPVLAVLFGIAAMGPAFVRNAEWGAIGVAVFGLCSAAVAIAFRALAFPSGSR